MTTEAIPESALRITSHEVLALLSFNPGEGASLSRRVLDLADLPQDSDLVRAGLTTLDVREMAASEQNGINLVGGALVLSVILSTAEQWFEITQYGASSDLPIYVVDSPHGLAALFSRPLSQYLCVPLRTGLNPLAFVAQTITSAAADAKGKGGGLIAVRRHRQGQEALVAKVKVNADGTAELAGPPLTQGGQATLTVLNGSTTPGEAAVKALNQS
ncbi:MULTISPECIES: hypothetical protein [Arthrobacter]|uniref:Uncharacterized protein n=1 Tax=Arthrobacter psychrochitiniphilus TaxID=291045 RepID=A0A2V3DN19_9MICC|nr:MULTISPECIES: hypothetical protein [Arthrobacter]NYG18534.1 hypothetical protein [Arthrobacter psychrochitiniphilus]PXA64345.1 hypothetical protein CVS29_15515 [Arthrobacter psychrochitiniphilus]